tara:strand:+ start:6443 stop:7705 length:1263 start_codon:yes stop_codon:yes gene_type:complete
MSFHYSFKILIIFILLIKTLSSHADTKNKDSKINYLDNFLQEVLEINPSVQAAKAEVNAAFANSLASNQPIYNPILDFDGERIRNDASEDTYTAGITQTIDLANKRKTLQRVGQLTTSKAQSELDEQKLIISITALTYLKDFNVYTQIVNLAQQRTELLTKFVNLTEKKYSSGSLDKASVDQSKLTLSEAIAQQAQAEISLSFAKEALATITNNFDNKWPNLPSDLPVPPRIQEVSKNSTQIIQNLPSLKILSYNVNVAKAQINVAQTNTIPNPTINFRGGQEDKKLLVGLNFSIPLFVRNNFQDQVLNIKHKAIAANEIRTSNYWKAKAHLEGTANRYNLLYTSYNKWKKASNNSLNEGIKLLDKLWDAEEINTFDYLTQFKLCIDSQITGVELKNSSWQAWIQWLKASGNFNQWLNVT